MTTDFSAVLTLRSGPASSAVSAGPWQVELDAAPGRIHLQPGLVAVLKGQLYDMDVQAMLRLYRQHGPAFARCLDGSFSLLLLNEAAGTVLAVTDRVGSHKLYALHDGQRVTVSTLPDHPDFTRRPYRPAGLASLLTSGALLNNLTLYEDVRALERASTHAFGPGGIHSCPYWELRPPAGLDARPEAELREEFGELLRRAVRRRTAGVHGPVHLSLSGGHDSRGLLSLLAAEGVDLRTFSYTQGPQASRSDTRTAQALAAQYGARHHTVQAYRGDLLATVRRNARWGHGVTNFCDEADAWDALAGPHFTHIFTGDEMHEIYPRRLSDVSEHLIRFHILPFGSLGSLTGRLAPPFRRTLEDAWAAELDQMRAAATQHANPYQQNFMIMSGQDLPHYLLSWRERFAGRVAAVHTPYLDAALAEFIDRLPPPMLAGKRLFIDTLTQLDPQLYRVPLARSSGYETDWRAELIRHREAVKEDLLAVSSRLDSFITPQAIRAVLDGLTAPGRGGPATLGTRVRRSLGTFRHSPAGQDLFGPGSSRVPSLSPVMWLLRVLTLRVLDTEAQRHNARLLKR